MFLKKITQSTYQVLTTAIFGLLLFACTKEKNLPTPNLGLDYFPLKVASVNLYDVDSTVYSDFTNTSTQYKFQIKDSVLSKSLDIENKEVYRIERFKKIDNGDWNFQQVMTKRITNNRAEEFSDNTRFIRLVFPAFLGTKWNGNLYNTQEAWPYEITAVDQSMAIGNNNVDSVLTISQYNEVNLIREDIYSESYAKHIGLVIKEIRALDKDISTGKIKKGLIYKLELSSYK
jgi:hypothetical protein